MASSGMSVCQPCPVSYYTSGTGLTQCAPCSIGTNATVTGSASCPVCAIAQPTNGRFIYLCGWVCNTGYYASALPLTPSYVVDPGSCLPCSNSSLCAPGQYRPMCTNGLYDNETCSGSCNNKLPSSKAFYSTPSINNSANGCDWACNAGYFRNQTLGSCSACRTQCATGQFISFVCSSPTLANPVCQTCKNVSNASFTAQGQPGNASSCPFVCNTGFWLARGNCTPWIATCPTGWAWNSGTPTSDATCTACPLGNQPTLYVYTPNTCTFSCGVGYQSVVGPAPCQACAPGTYKNTIGNTSCTPCAPNYYQPNTFSTNCLQVPTNGVATADSSNFVCNAGYYYYMAPLSSTVSCPACSAGQYSSAASMACTNCMPGTVSAQSASPTCTSCVLGSTYAVGYGYTACAQCLANCALGYMMSPSCSLSMNAGCVQCTYTASSVYVYQANTCIYSCGPGYQPLNGACSACGVGYFKADASNNACATCAAGTYQFQVASSACAACAAGLYVSLAGQTTCSVCGPGVYSVQGSAVCAGCAVGTYSTAQGATVCSACAAGNVSGRGATYCYPSGSQTAYLQPGLSQTCQWLYYNNYGCACWNSLSMMWNENNGPSPLGSTCSAAGGTCNLAALVASSGSCPAFSVTYFVGVPTSLTVQVFGYQPPACSQCYQSVASAVAIPSNCASSLAPTAQVCYNYNQCSGCGCFKSVWGSTAVCHSCNAGYYSQVPSFTVCMACAAGTFSTGQGLLDTVEWPNGVYTFSSSMTAADCQMPKLDSEGAWCPQTVAASEWIQLDLGSQQTVKGIVTQGRATAREWATAVNLISSLDAKTWTAATGYGANVDSYARQVTFVTPFVTRYLRLSPGTYSQWFSLRWNALVQISACSTCPAGMYAASISSSVCSACTQQLPANSYFSVGCTWMCNVGYYAVGSGCSRCSDSSACSAGQYRPNCTDGLTNAQTCSGVCVNKAQSPQSVYLGPSADNSNASCSWGCNAGYYKNLSSMCASCQLNCSAGFYASTLCLVSQSQAISAPTCLPCAPVANAVFQVGNTCPFSCVYGFFLQQGACVAWSANCSRGYAWSPGTNTSDRNCTACQYVGQQTIYVYGLNTCNFNCTVGYFFTSGVCQACASGKYKATNDGSQCVACLPSYQPSTGMGFCLTVPSNGVANGQGTDFVCNVGYYYSTSNPALGPVCLACAGYPVVNAQGVQWSGCNVTTLACNTGYYRNWTQLACPACPTQLPANSAGWGVPNMTGFCAACSSTQALQDKLMACPFLCNMGYYQQNYSCVRCRTVTCNNNGYYAQMCTGPSSSFWLDARGVLTRGYRRRHVGQLFALRIPAEHLPGVGEPVPVAVRRGLLCNPRNMCGLPQWHVQVGVRKSDLRGLWFGGVCHIVHRLRRVRARHLQQPQRVGERLPGLCCGDL